MCKSASWLDILHVMVDMGGFHAQRRYQNLPHELVSYKPPGERELSSLEDILVSALCKVYLQPELNKRRLVLFIVPYIDCDRLSSLLYMKW